MAKEDSKRYPLAVFPSYMAMILNSVGSKTYRNLYYQIEGKKNDVLEKGNLACAFYASNVLLSFKLIGDFRTSVEGLVEEMIENGWKETKKPRPGCVIVWEEVDGHKHIGFYAGGWRKRAVSNSSRKKMPIKHKFTADPSSKRPRYPIMFLWHERLEK